MKTGLKLLGALATVALFQHHSGLAAQDDMTVIQLSLLGSTSHRLAWSPTPAPVYMPDLQLLPASWRVTGLRLSLGWGENTDITGLDFGVAGRARGELTGVGLTALLHRADRGVWGLQASGLVNLSGQSVRGVQVALLGNWTGNPGDVLGGQLALGVNCTKHTSGCQFGALNLAENIDGAQLGLINCAPYFGINDMVAMRLHARTVTGAQLGVALNVADKTVGCQAAALNLSRELVGLQFGAANWLSSPRGDVGTWGEGKGCQLGFVNVARTVRGTQVGLVNYCPDLTGIQVGLLNICKGDSWRYLPLVNWNF